VSLLSGLGFGKKDGPRPILVVDDSEDIREFIGDTLEMAGYAVVKAADGEEGFTKFEAEDPCLVLLDIRMPNWNGLKALTRIKLTDKGKETPCMMITAEQKGADVEEAFRRGAVDYIIKPVDIKRMMEKVQKHALPPTKG